MLNLHTKKTKLNSKDTNLNQTKTIGEKMKPGLCVKSENKVEARSECVDSHGDDEPFSEGLRK